MVRVSVKKHAHILSEFSFFLVSSQAVMRVIYARTRTLFHFWILNKIMIKTFCANQYVLRVLCFVHFVIVDSLANDKRIVVTLTPFPICISTWRELDTIFSTNHSLSWFHKYELFSSRSGEKWRWFPCSLIHYYLSSPQFLLSGSLLIEIFQAFIMDVNLFDSVTATVL